jgi:hypothetical protein
MRAHTAGGHDVRRRFLAIGVAVVLLVVVGHARTGSGAAATVFSGTVSGSDQGFLTAASVVIDGPVRREARTDADGRFTMPDVPRGRYRLLVTADGYLPLDRPLDVGDASVSVDILLLRIPGL